MKNNKQIGNVRGKVSIEVQIGPKEDIMDCGMYILFQAHASTNRILRILYRNRRVRLQSDIHLVVA